MSEPALRPYVVFGFESTHDALTAESVLAAGGLPLTVMPTPKSLGALCGIALRIAETDVPAAEKTMMRAGIVWTASARILDR